MPIKTLKTILYVTLILLSIRATAQAFKPKQKPKNHNRSTSAGPPDFKPKNLFQHLITYFAMPEHNLPLLPIRSSAADRLKLDRNEPRH
eukprot:COSAG01_NODE_2485_length_7594_cov_36.632021_5_plen_89_part_00